MPTYHIVQRRMDAKDTALASSKRYRLPPLQVPAKFSNIVEHVWLLEKTNQINAFTMLAVGNNRTKCDSEEFELCRNRKLIIHNASLRAGMVCIDEEEEQL